MRVMLVGCGGYAALYAQELLQQQAGQVDFVGIVDPYAAQSRVYGDIVAQGIPLYDTMEAFYSEQQADLAIVSTPIALHHAGALACLKNGSHLLLEKPMTATVSQAREVVQAAQAADRKLGIGFQLCYDPVMLRLKEEIDAGNLGKPVALRSMVLWQRNHAYYARSGGWAGKRTLADGTPVNDSILTNATAHYLMNMLWLTTPGFSTQPALSCQAQLGRAYPIETFDTCAARYALPAGCDALIYLSHVAGAAQEQNPMMEYTFEKGTVRAAYAEGRGGLRVTVTDYAGHERELGYTHEGVAMKLKAMIDAVAKDAPLTCPGEAGLASMISNDMVFQHDLADVETFHPIVEDAESIWAPGVGETLRAAYEARALPKEMGKRLQG